MTSRADTIDRTSGLGPILEARELLEVTSCIASMPLLKVLSVVTLECRSILLFFMR